MTRRLVFADSEVAAVSVVDGALQVRFAAAHVRDADAGSFSGWRDGHLAGVTLVLAGGPWPEVAGDRVGRLADGRLSTGGGGQVGDAHGDLPLPCTLDGPLRLALRFANGAQLDVAAQGLRVLVADGAAFSESFAC